MIVLAAGLTLAACSSRVVAEPSPAGPCDYMKLIADNPEYLFATDRLYPTDYIALTPAPKGYKPFYISHYGRHGARYAWQSDLYDTLEGLFSKEAASDNLTPLGKSFKDRFDSLYPSVRYRVGDLSRKGWQQQTELGELMYDNFPAVFTDDAAVRAWTSTSTRCVMTMSAFCIGLKGRNPKIDIFENFGKYFLPAILPLDGHNPFRRSDYKVTPLSLEEDIDSYARRTVDCRAILSRLFSDPEAAVPTEKQLDIVSYLYYFAAGMNSLDTDLDFTDIFTHEQRVAMWKADNYQFYCYGWPVHLGYMPIVEDIIAKADERIEKGEKGADLRFGHDYTILPLMMILDVDGMGHDVKDPEDVSSWCRTDQVPMGANLQIIFYRKPSGGDILFKVLHNGREAHIGLETDIWPYYRWSSFKARWGGE